MDNPVKVMLDCCWRGIKVAPSPSSSSSYFLTWVALRRAKGWLKLERTEQKEQAISRQVNFTPRKVRVYSYSAMVGVEIATCACRSKFPSPTL